MRILVVDDNVVYAKTIPRVLDEHDVTLATSGKEALELLRSGLQFDVVLCDLVMPVMTGMELHAAIAAEIPDMLSRIVFVTGGAFTSGAQAFLQSVPNRCLEKPIPPDALRAAILEIAR